MPTDVSDTGQGATIAFSSTTFAARIRSMDLGEQAGGKINDDTLATTGFHEYIPEDLVEPNEVTYDISWPTSLDLPTINGTPETITVTFPLRDGAGGEGTAANMAGTGFVTRIKYPEMQSGAIQQGTITVCYDGKTGPTFTKSTA